MDVPEIYKLRRTIDSIERLQGGGERSMRIEEINTLVDLLTDGHMFLSGPLDEGLTVFRGRHVQDEPFKNVSLMGVRDPLTVMDYGRCHSPKKSVLYASINLETVISELGADIGAKIQIVEIRKKPSQDVLCTSVGSMDHVRRHGRGSRGGDEEVKMIKEYWGTLSELERLRHNLVDAFFADKFRQPAKYAHEYKVTSTFSKTIFDQGLDAFFYPSVGHLGGWNLVITPEAYARGFEVISCEVIEVTETPGYGIFASKPVLEYGEIKGDQFIWRTPSEVMAYGSFDEYVWHHMSYPGQKTMLFRLMVNANDEFSSEYLDNIFKDAAPSGSTNFALKLMNSGSFDLRYDRDFAYVVKSLGDQTPWDFIACMVIPTINAAEVESKLTEFHQNLEAGKYYELFTKEGKWVPPPIAGEPLAKD